MNNETLKAPSGWQPIETAPKDGTRAMLQLSITYATAEWLTISKMWRYVDDEQAAPTHWRPLEDYARP
jgi:hypothetical protein